MNRIKLTLPLVFITLFILSSLFPISASLIHVDALPGWLGITDVILAFIVVGLMILIVTRAQGKINSQAKEKSSNIYQFLGAIPLFLLMIFFVVGDAIKWNVLLPGLAWRGWAFIYSLPSVLALLGQEPSDH